jgi:hypothetical protein
MKNYQLRSKAKAVDVNFRGISVVKGIGPQCFAVGLLSWPCTKEIVR